MSKLTISLPEVCSAYTINRCTPFINAVTSTLEHEFPQQHSREQIVQATHQYLVWVARSRKVEGSNAGKSSKLQKATAARIKGVSIPGVLYISIEIHRNQLRESMKQGFEASLLNRCRERNLFALAFNSGAMSLPVLTHEDDHGLPRVDEELTAGYDGFQLYQDLWSGRKCRPTAAFVALDPEWWSQKVCFPVIPSMVSWTKLKRSVEAGILDPVRDNASQAAPHDSSPDLPPPHRASTSDIPR